LPVPIFRLWLVLALGFGLMEGAYMRFLQVGLHQSTKLGPHVIWMAPVMDLIWFAVPALLLLLARWAWPTRVTLRGAAGIFLFVGFITLLFVFDGLERIAATILAAGLAFQLSRLLSNRRAGLVTVLQWGCWILPSVVALAAGGVFLSQRLTERRELARLGTAAPGAPNVLLLVLDTVRSWSVSADGYDRPTTPELEEFARSGVRFSRAWAPSSWTLLSHESMFTGYLPHQLSGGLRTALDGAVPTLAEALSQRGYSTAGFVANLHYCSREFGLSRGFIHYEDYVVSGGELLLNSALGRFLATSNAVRNVLGFYDIVGRKDAAEMNRSLLAWTAQHRERPFFAFVNYYDAHEPYLPPADFEARFAPPTPRKLFNTDQSIRGARMLFKQHFTPQEIRRERDSYDASIAYIDAQLRSLLATLKARGLLDNTLVIITADHGEQFGDRGLFVHGNSLYEPVMSVPFVMALPGRIPADTVVRDRVNTRDLPATILELAGGDQPSRFPGRSLTRFWAADTLARQGDPLVFEVVSTTRDLLRSLVVGDTQYIRHRNGTEELHLLQRNENTPDIAAAPGNAVLIGTLRARLDSVLKETGPDKWGD
jgi:arylsulfatase A-like enzyme